MAGDTTFGCPNGGRWDIRVRQGTGPGPGLRGNGYKLTKVGSGSVSIACQRTTTGYWDMNLGDVFINEGGLTFAEAVRSGQSFENHRHRRRGEPGTYDLELTNPLAAEYHHDERHHQRWRLTHRHQCLQRHNPHERSKYAVSK